MLYGIECTSWADIGSDYLRFSSNFFIMDAVGIQIADKLSPNKTTEEEITLDGEENEDLMFLQTSLKCEDNLLEINANKLLTWFVNKLLIQLQLSGNKLRRDGVKIYWIRLHCMHNRKDFNVVTGRRTEK